MEERILESSLVQKIIVDSRLQGEIASLSRRDCNAINLVTQSLFNIAPNVILAKREVSKF